jgi:hypothetical protein
VVKINTKYNISLTLSCKFLATKYSGGLFRQGYGRIKYTESRKNKTRIEEYRCIRMAYIGHRRGA